MVTILLKTLLRVGKNRLRTLSKKSRLKIQARTVARMKLGGIRDGIAYDIAPRIPLRCIRATTSFGLQRHPGSRRETHDHILSSTACSAGSRTPPAHQMRHAPSSDTMHGPMGVRGVQAAPYKPQSVGYSFPNTT